MASNEKYEGTTEEEMTDAEMRSPPRRGARDRAGATQVAEVSDGSSRVESSVVGGSAVATPPGQNIGDKSATGQSGGASADARPSPDVEGSALVYDRRLSSGSPRGSPPPKRKLRASTVEKTLKSRSPRGDGTPGTSIRSRHAAGDASVKLESADDELGSAGAPDSRTTEGVDAPSAGTTPVTASDYDAHVQLLREMTAQIAAAPGLETSLYESTRKMFETYDQQLAILVLRLGSGSPRPQRDHKDNPLPPEGTNSAALEYANFPHVDMEINPIDIALLIHCEMTESMQADSLRLALVRDASTLRAELSRYRFYEFATPNHASPHSVALMLDARALRRGCFMMALYYRGSYYCVQCGHLTVKYDQHGFCVLCLCLYIRTHRPAMRPCHLMRDSAGELLCENCAAMPLESFNKRGIEYARIDGELAGGAKPDKPETLPKYGWSPLHINAASIVDIYDKLSHFGISLPQSVDEAEVTAAMLRKAEADYARERREYNRLPKGKRGAPQFKYPSKPNSSTVGAERRKLFERARNDGDSSILFPGRPKPPPLVRVSALGTVETVSAGAIPESPSLLRRASATIHEVQMAADRARHAQLEVARCTTLRCNLIEKYKRDQSAGLLVDEAIESARSQEVFEAEERQTRARRTRRLAQNDYDALLPAHPQIERENFDVSLELTYEDCALSSRQPPVANLAPRLAQKAEVIGTITPVKPTDAMKAYKVVGLDVSLNAVELRDVHKATHNRVDVRICDDVDAYLARQASDTTQSETLAEAGPIKVDSPAGEVKSEGETLSQTSASPTPTETLDQQLVATEEGLRPLIGADALEIVGERAPTPEDSPVASLVDELSFVADCESDDVKSEPDEPAVMDTETTGTEHQEVQSENNDQTKTDEAADMEVETVAADSPEVRVTAREHTPSPVLPPVDTLVDAANRMWRDEEAARRDVPREVPTPDGAHGDDDVHTPGSPGHEVAETQGSEIHTPENSRRDIAETHDDDVHASTVTEQDIAEVREGDAPVYTSTPITSPITTVPVEQDRELVTADDARDVVLPSHHPDYDNVTNVVARSMRRGSGREGSAPPTVDTLSRTRPIDLLQQFRGSPAVTAPARSLSVATPTSPVPSQHSAGSFAGTGHATAPIFRIQAPVLHLYVTPEMMGSPISVPLQQALTLNVVVHPLQPDDVEAPDTESTAQL